jgi:acyl-coenzyme A synthetase/AMP-(fatty) acid ligase
LNTQKYSPLTDRLPEDVIAFRSDGAMNVGQFLRAARRWSEQLPAHKYVFNLFTDRFQFLLGFCASVIAGQCTLLPPNRLEKTLEQLTVDYPDSHILGNPDSAYGELFAPEALDKLAGAGNGVIPDIPENQLCAIAFTSGSTGKAKPNLKYWGTLRTGSLNNAEFLLKDTARLMNLLATVPPQHMWGFEASILLPLFGNAAVSHLAPFFPQDIVEALESLPEPRGLISSPVHLKVLLKSGVRPPGLERIYCSTAPLDKGLTQELEQRFKTRVVEVFGSSETGMLAFRHTADESSWQLSGLFELDVQEGGVLVRGQHLPEKILLQDVIEKTGETRFSLLGRHQDMLNIAGKRGSLTDLNRRLLAIPKVEDGVIFMPKGDTERLAALVVAPNLEPSDIVGTLRLEIDTVFLPRPVYIVSELPRQETGKLANEDLLILYREIVQMRKSDKRDCKPG